MPTLLGEHYIPVSRNPAVIIPIKGLVHLSNVLLGNPNTELTVQLGVNRLAPYLGGSLSQDGRQTRGLPRLTGRVARLEEQPSRYSSYRRVRGAKLLTVEHL